MDNRSGFPFIPGFTAQTRAWLTGAEAKSGLRLEWTIDNETNPGFWTYSYKLIRGAERNKGFAYFDIETAADFSAGNIIGKQVISATDRNGDPIPSGLDGITISDPVNFDAIHDFTNAPITEASFTTALSKNEMSHYSGDPGRVPVGQPGGLASATPSVGPVAHPFYGIRVTFPGSFLDLAYEASEWEFRIVTDRIPMWGKMFGWGDQTVLTPFWYANFYNESIDSPNRLTLAPVSNLTGAGPYRGWVLVPGSLPSVLSTTPANGATLVPVTEYVTVDFSGVMNPATITSTAFTLTNGGPVSGMVNYDQSSMRAIFQPDVPLSPNTTYTATITVDVADLAGNAMPAPFVWSFTTSSVDTGAPSVTATFPENGDEYVATGSVFKVTFSEAMDPATLNEANFSIAGVTGTIDYDAATRTAILTPGMPLGNNTTYTATLATGVTDLAGNPLVAPVQWTVTTIPQETVLPYVVSTFPSAGMVNVITTSTISATFSEPIDPATLAPSTFFVAGLSGTIHYDPSTLTATFAPDTPLASNTNYALTVTTGVRDLAGNPLGLTKVFSFRTLNTSSSNFSASGVVSGPGGAPLAGISLLVIRTSQSGTAPQIVVTDGAGQFTAVQLLTATYLITPRSTGSMFSPQQINFAVTTTNVTGLNFISNPLTLSPDKASPQVSGSQVSFLASVLGGAGAYEYEFWLWSGASWAMVQPYSSTNTWMLPTSTSAGLYTVQVNARNAGSQVEKAASARVTNFQLISQGAATGVTLTATPANLQAVGSTVTFQAEGQGGTAYEYEFWLWSGISWELVQAYSAINTWNMPATTPVGLYTVQVNVRGAGSTIEKDTQARITNYRILAPAATGVTLTATPANSQTEGSSVTFQAAGQGSSAYEYEFWLWSGVSWEQVQGYSSADFWVLPDSTPTGLYTIQVNVRSAGSSVESDALARIVNYQITN